MPAASEEEEAQERRKRREEREEKRKRKYQRAARVALAQCGQVSFFFGCKNIKAKKITVERQRNKRGKKRK